MFLRAFLLLAFVLPYPFAKAQNVSSHSPFPNSILTAPGLNYYPQQWPMDQWAEDFKNMDKLGIEFVNMGDKAWASWQKNEGSFNFTGIEEAVNLAGQAGLKVVITIPVTDPPAWLRKSYENIANEGVPQLSNEIYANAVKLLVKGLARKFAQNPYIQGWIIPSATPQQWESMDRSQFAEKQFQDWLSTHFQQIDSLNNSWGTGFVGEPFGSFGEVQFPAKGSFSNPLMEASYREFRSAELQEFNKENIIELASYVPQNQWVSLHVQAPASFQNPWEYEKLNFLTWSRDESFEGFDDARDLGKHTAFYKSFFNSSGVLGFQNDEKATNRFTPETQRIALYQALASGNHFMSPYRYRQPHFHVGAAPASMVKRDGKTLTGYGKVYQQFIEEIEILRDKYPKITEMPEELRKRRSAIVYNPAQLWKQSYSLERESWDYLSHLEGYHRVLKSMGCPVKFIQGNQDYTPFNILIVAGYESIDPAMLGRLKEFVKTGGNIIFTARSDSKNEQGTYLQQGPSSHIASLTGATVVTTDQIHGQESSINHRGKGYSWNNWGEVLELSGCVPLATHGAQDYSGRAAASFKTVSRGSASYFGFDTDEKVLEFDLVRKVFERMRIPHERMHLGMTKEWRDGFWFGLNFGLENKRVPMDPYARIYLGNLDLGQGEMCVWREKFKPGEDNAAAPVPTPKAPIPTPTADKEKPSKTDGKKNKKVKKEKVQKAPVEGEKSLFEQTMQKRKKKN